MALTSKALHEAYGVEFPRPEKWELGPLIAGSHAMDTMPTQLIDGPSHPAQIEVHGDYCDSIAKQIVDLLNGEGE
jgi:hypothetical protein